MVSDLFGMADMPFPYNGIVLIQGNLLRVILVFTLKLAKVDYFYASFLIPYNSIDNCKDA